MTKKKGPPPIIGECAKCGTRFTSKYARKTHRCSPVVEGGKFAEMYERLVAARKAGDRVSAMSALANINSSFGTLGRKS